MAMIELPEQVRDHLGNCAAGSKERHVSRQAALLQGAADGFVVPDPAYLSPADFTKQGLAVPVVRLERYGSPKEPWRNTDTLRDAKIVAAARFNAVVGVFVEDYRDMAALARRALKRNTVGNIHARMRQIRIMSILSK